ncbi:MAG: hypothetical protein M0Q41_05110 [Bacteroidales bacterium]|nr:hypothetical protein [Bacteroidales bacterium]
MKRIKTLAVLGLLCGLLLPSMLSCKKNSNELPVEFQLRVLDTLGIEKSVFKQGENIVFSFVIENKSSEDLFFFHAQMNTTDFFRLYKLDSSQNHSDLGKPYKHIFCEMIGGLTIPATGSLKIEIPWLWHKDQNYGYIGCPNDNYHSDTHPLTKGEYRSAFSSAFKIDDIQTEVKHFEVKFSVK